MEEIYYKPGNLWKGKKAINELKTSTNFKEKHIKLWLYKQAFWQIYLPKPKIVKRPHYMVTIPNKLHQFDILYMPWDKLYGNQYKYILSGIDVASRYKVARPLKTKKAKEVSEMISDIYKVGPLTYPNVVEIDNGSEFKSDVTKLFEKHDVIIKRATTKYKHTHTAFVENLNKVLAENLFRIQNAQELHDSNKVSTRWVKYLYSLIDKLNDTKTDMIDMKPKDAIKLKSVPLKAKYDIEEVLPDDGLYRYLLQPGEEHNDTKRRVTDPTWSKITYRISEIIKEPNNRIIYMLENGPGRSFVREELMWIPEDTELPPKYVKNW